MGMLQTILKSCKPEADAAAYNRLLIQQAQRLVSNGDQDGDRPEHADVSIVDEKNFAEFWKDQENIIQNDETRTKYLERAKAGRLFAITIDW